MKRIALAVVLAFAALGAQAQAPAVDVPKHKCDPKPEYPGRLALQSDTRRKSFEREIKAYQECINKYIEERKAFMKANEEVANAAINEYNATMKAINTAQEAAKD